MVTALLALPMAAVAQGTRAAPADLHKEGIDLIRSMEITARELHYNTEWLRMHSRSMNTSMVTHNDHLSQVKELVNNEPQPALTRLQEIQGQLPEWHQDTIDQLFTSARALAADANSAIASHRDKGALPAAANLEYQAFVKGMNQHAEALVKTADAAGEYAKAHQQAVEAGLNVHRY
jgi:hypothetical protein